MRFRLRPCRPTRCRTDEKRRELHDPIAPLTRRSFANSPYRHDRAGASAGACKGECFEGYPRAPCRRQTKPDTSIRAGMIAMQPLRRGAERETARPPSRNGGAARGHTGAGPGWGHIEAASAPRARGGAPISVQSNLLIHSALRVACRVAWCARSARPDRRAAQGGAPRTDASGSDGRASCFRRNDDDKTEYRRFARLWVAHGDGALPAHGRKRAPLSAA